MSESLDLSKCYRVTREEFQANVDCMLEMVESGCSPILIYTEGKPDLLLFGWSDYLERFGCLYTAEQIAEIEEACRNYKEQDE
jgi:hypothetical protein